MIRKKVTQNDVVSVKPTDKSSFIKSISYTNTYKVLVVTFDSGSIWCYDEVPKEVFHALAIAESAGKYFNKKIRNKYAGTAIYRPSEETNHVVIKQDAS